jgi:hypothetical protein
MLSQTKFVCFYTQKWPMCHLVTLSQTPSPLGVTYYLNDPLYSRYRDQNIMLEHTEYAYKKKSGSQTL